MNNFVKPFIIAIAGGTGSGKTFIAKKLQAIDPKNIALLSHDRYYRDRSDVPVDQRELLNYDEPAALDNDLLLEHIEALKDGKAIEIPQYDFATHTRLKETTKVLPTPVIIVEGILILAKHKIREMFDLTVFIEVEPDIRLARRLERDVGTRERTFQESINQYMASAQPMHDKYVEPGKDYADIIINNNHTLEELDVGIQVLEARIKEVLGRCQ
ncbi:uridine kinase [Patescibacteria group bacterium]|nr:uridine kinase [Patescibacteria group bacterium]